MIVAKLMGGMGNQMFQYAAARRIAYKRNTTLKLDLGFLKADPPDITVIKRDYELGVFNIVESFSIQSEINALFFKVRHSIFSKIRDKLFPTWYVREPQFTYNEFLKNAPSRTYLDGFWQSEKYFKDIEFILRAEFSFKNPAEGQNHIFQKQIKNTENPVSLHVRRGDYVSNQFTFNYHGICGLDYYQEAIKHIASQIKNPHFFIFSDDPQWVSENLSTGFPSTYISHNSGKQSFEDMRLMSTCHHHIIANSSFSWWGAWLNPSPDKMVIAPKNWFKDSSIDTKDLLPPGWIKL